MKKYPMDGYSVLSSEMYNGSTYEKEVHIINIISLLEVKSFHFKHIKAILKCSNNFLNFQGMLLTLKG